MIRKTLLCCIIIALLIFQTVQQCRNTTDFKYDLIQPAQITNYYSICSTWTKRTCCSLKNLDLLTKKIKKITDSVSISSGCKNALTQILCSACDGDYGQGYYNGICSTTCYGLYQSCQNDYFVVEGNNQIRGCKQQDLFCWKLKDLLAHFYVDIDTIRGRAQICNYFEVTGSQHEVDCWRGQISSEIRGKGKKKFDYTASKNVKKIRSSWFHKYIKQIIYAAIVIILGIAVFYKFYRSTRRHYHRLN